MNLDAQDVIEQLHASYGRMINVLVQEKAQLQVIIDMLQKQQNPAAETG